MRVLLVAGAVKITLLMLVAVATPRTGVTNAGLVAKTTEPVPTDAIVVTTPAVRKVKPESTFPLLIDFPVVLLKSTSSLSTEVAVLLETSPPPPPPTSAVPEALW